MNFNFKLSFFFFIFITLLICIFFIPILSINSNLISTNTTIPYSSSSYVWPIPGNYHITSYFGKRNSPTSGASTYHLGVDIAASEGSSLIAIDNGKVIFIGFKGSGGYTISYQTENFVVSYCHISPNFIVKTGDIIYQGQRIGYVGPKNVYDVLNNPYKDSNRKSNKWCYYWNTFTFYNKKRRASRQSFRLFLITYHHYHRRHPFLLVHIQYYFLHYNLNGMLNTHHDSVLLHSSLIQLHFYILDKLLLFLLHLQNLL